MAGSARPRNRETARETANPPKLLRALARETMAGSARPREAQCSPSPVFILFIYLIKIFVLFFNCV